MPGEIARQWFVPGDGIDRHVISADIQRYLGNDATVRPGDNQGVNGYWIKAYRNLTSAMISDLRADSQRWRQEQRQTGTRDQSYVGSRTYEASSASRAAQRRDGDSPSMDVGYGGAPVRQGRNQVDSMQIDSQPPARGDHRYGGAPQPQRGGYPPENGAFPSQGRDRYQDQGRPPYQQDQPMQDVYRGPQVTSSYGNEPRYAPSYPDPNAGAPGYYVPVSTSGYGNPSIMAPSRGPEPQQYPPQPFGQPQAPTRDSRDHRDHRDRDPRDPRYGGQPEYGNDPRYAYPSPAATVSSVAGRERDPISSPQQPSPFGGAPPQYDQYGRPVQPPAQDMYGSSNPGYPPQSGGPGYSDRRQPAPPTGGDRERSDGRRRRLH